MEDETDLLIDRRAKNSFESLIKGVGPRQAINVFVESFLDHAEYVRMYGSPTPETENKAFAFEQLAAKVHAIQTICD